ncbi:MAG: sulfate permease [Anaerolineales bacterium]|nr:sulfate permease [Anaerolineales bacterium]MCB8986576.1 sulfate permease [Ardenticatenaceae bacterium]
MLAKLGPRLRFGAVFAPSLYYLQRPLRLFRTYDKSYLRPDIVAGLTVAVILLPQAIAFALIAELPPQMGLYTAIVGAIFAALWGSSNQMQTGPTNSISLLVSSTLAGIYIAGTPEYIVAAGMMAFMAGALQLAMGLARLGILINFVSHSLLVGFATGAGIIIAIRQIESLLGLDLPGGTVIDTVTNVVVHFPQSDVETAVIGFGTMLFIIAMKRLNPKLPAALLSIVLASFFVFIFHLDQAGVEVVGELSGQFPPIAPLPIFDFDLIARLSPGALAISIIGLIEGAAIGRTISNQTRQRLNNNQEFVGQGLANMACGIFSGFAVDGSYSRSAINFEAGARSPFAAVFSAVFVILAMLLIAPLGRYIPTSALSGVLIVTALGMIDRTEIKRIWRGAPGDAAIMLLTLFGTLFLSLEFAVLLGILLSFSLYVLRTSTPRVQAVQPDASFKHFTYQPDKDPCPQLNVIEILGDLYFGAVNHVEETLLEHLNRHPDQLFLLLRMHSVAQLDFSGIHMLESIVRTYRERGGDVYMVRVSPAVMRIMESTGFDEFLGSENFLDDDTAISYLFYRQLDPAICIYECPWRVFKECQNLPKRIDLIGLPKIGDVPEDAIPTVPPQQLWNDLHAPDRPQPYILDVREPREFGRGHIPEAHLMPLADIMADQTAVPPDTPIVLVCRRGRRSRRAAHILQQRGLQDVRVMEGGMVAWEAAGLLEAVEL